MPKKQTLSRKIKVLAYGDSPVVPSGFGTVMKNIFYYLGKTGKYDIDLFGINDRGAWKDPQEHPYHVYQAMPPGETDPYGRSRFVDTLRGGGLDLQPPWDIVFFLNDPFVLENPIPFFNLGTLPATKDIQKTHYTQLPPDMWFKTVGYFPVDSPVKPHWVMSAINLVDYPVTYTRYGQTEIEKASWVLEESLTKKVQVIPHGNNFADFYPLLPETITQFKKDYFGSAVREETFLVIVVGRNQRRKDIPRAMKIFREFQKRRPDSFLYIHAEEQEMWGSLRETALQFGLKQGKDWNYPQDFVATKGFPVNILNAIYNAADVNLTTTQGEGWGLPITEAMAAKTINLAPAHTAIPELFNLSPVETGHGLSLPDILEYKSLRGLPIKAGSNSSEWVCHGAPDLERIRPLTNVDDAVQKLLWIYDHPTEVKQITNRAHKWISTLSWQKVATMWDTLFTQAFLDLEAERQTPQKYVKRWQKVNVPGRPHPLNNKPLK
jgi:glycosyltransferase involved in cell wall biosynthesis